MHGLKERAKKALNKKAVIGRDIDLNKYKLDTPQHNNPAGLSSLCETDLLSAGIIPSGEGRSGSYIQEDHSVTHCNITQDGVEISAIADALEKYDWLKDYWWNAMAVDTDKFTAFTELQPYQGYFMRVEAGKKTIYPLQACLYMEEEGVLQSVHNVIIAEEGSEMNIITGCTTASGLHSGLHLGVSEFYVKKGAKVTFTMIHNWKEEVAVRPRTGVVVEEGGVFISNYVCLKPVRDLQTFPTAYLNGDNAVAHFSSILVAPEGSYLDTGARVYLNGRGSRSEIISRAISSGGTIMARGHLIGKAEDIKAHLECQGLILTEKGIIHAIPELEGHLSGVDMSHEAAVGKIAQEEIEYLMARGLSEQEATATIVRGFLNVEIEGLPPELKREIDRAIAESEKDLF